MIKNRDRNPTVPSQPNPELKLIMTNPNALYEDMEKLNALYEELCWGHDDELVFTHENGRVIIYNKTIEDNN